MPTQSWSGLASTTSKARIFNPFKTRWRSRLFWTFELLWNLNRLNHRMHNKVLIADGISAIIGGRNIGDVRNVCCGCGAYLVHIDRPGNDVGDVPIAVVVCLTAADV